MKSNMEEAPINRSKVKLYILVVILAVVSLAFRVINDFFYEQTSVLFVGLPALLTILVINYYKTPKTAYGVVFKTITIFLLMSSILLGEGILCVIFAAPIFYGIGAVIVYIVEYNKNKKNSKLYSLLVIPVLLVLAQPFGILEEPEIQSVQTSVILQNDVSINSFNKHPDFMKDYPNFFKIGFPEPVGINGTGTSLGDVRNIQFESTTKGIGTLSLEVTSKTETSIVFKAVKDNTHINHWLSWKKMKVELVHLDDNKTEVKWTSSYQCELGPHWYFEPLEAFAVKTMNKHLLDAYFNQQ